MAKAIMIASSSTQTFATGEEFNVFGYLGESSTESNTQVSCTEGATFSGLGTNIISGGSGTNNFRFRDAGADGNQLASIAGAGVVEDAVNSDTLTAGDLFNIAYTDTGSNSTCSYVKMNVEFASGYGSFMGGATYGGSVFDAQSTTRFICLAGNLFADGDTSETNSNFVARGFTSYEAIQATVSANARTNDSTFTNRIATANGTGAAVFGAGITGTIADTGLGDAIADGNTIGAAITLDTGVEDLTVTCVVGTLKSTTTKQDIWSYVAAGRARAASATAHYYPLSGEIPTNTAFTEAQARVKIGYAGTASNLRARLSANTYASDGTLKLMLNGSAVITLTLTASGGAGTYENSSDTAAFDADDELSLELDEGGASGSITVQMMGLTLAPTVVSATSGHRVIGGGSFGRVIGE